MSLFIQEAVKERLKARIAIDGPTGAGKTWTMLQFATVLAGGPRSEGGAPIGVVDTENRSAAYYAPTPGKEVKRLNPWDPPYEFFHLPVRAPYDPRDLARIIDAAHDDLGDDGVLCIDSLTHYWNGEGGTLDIVDDAASRGGNSFTGWKEGTPAQRFMLDKIIHAPFHVIVTMRSKMEYVLEEQMRDGRKTSVPKKLGMAPEQRSGVEYEFTVVADMDLEHRLIVSKSRCDEVADLVMPKGRSVDVIQTFTAWLGTGVVRVSPDDVAALSALFNEPRLSADDRKAVKVAFVGVFGQPAEMLTDKLDEAVLWIVSKIDRIVGPAPEPPPQAAEPEPAVDSLEFPAATDLAPEPEPHDDPPTPDDTPADPPATTRRRATAAK